MKNIGKTDIDVILENVRKTLKEKIDKHENCIVNFNIVFNDGGVRNIKKNVETYIPVK